MQPTHVYTLYKEYIVPTRLTAHVVAYAMASQPVASSWIDSFSFDSFVRGYHVYMDCWDPWIGEVLPLEREPTNPEDQCAVGIKILAQLLDMSCLT